MRYRGGGVGHSSTRSATDFFKRDRHPRDQNRNQQDEMDVDDVDQPHRNDDGFDQDEILGSSDDPGSDVDEQDEDQGSDDEESNRDDDEEGDGDESETEQLGFSEL